MPNQNHREQNLLEAMKEALERKQADALEDALEGKQADTLPPTPYHDINHPSRRRLKISGVEERTGVHRQTIWRWYTAGLFPKPHYLGSERMWFEDEVELFEEAQMAKRAAEIATA